MHIWVWIAFVRVVLLTFAWTNSSIIIISIYRSNIVVVNGFIVIIIIIFVNDYYYLIDMRYVQRSSNYIEKLHFRIHQMESSTLKYDFIAKLINFSPNIRHCRCSCVMQMEFISIFKVSSYLTTQMAIVQFIMSIEIRLFRKWPD